MFDSEVLEARFCNKNFHWILKLSSQKTVTSRILVAATGGLHNPAIPVLTGIQNFKGKSFHTAQWDNSADLHGKNIAIIGTGASGVQVAPHLAKISNKLYVFQRTPAWISPKNSEVKFTLLKRLPFFIRHIVLRYLRIIAFLKGEKNQFAYSRSADKMSLLSRLILKSLSYSCKKNLENNIKDPILRAKLTPDYKVGCKRRLFSNSFYQIFSQPNVSLITQKIKNVTEDRIVLADNTSLPVDVIVYATGFRNLDVNGEITTTVYRGINIIGLNDISLYDRWYHEGSSSYKGVTHENFPNFFTLIGPTSGIGAGTILFMMECQFNYILGAVKWMFKNKARKFELRPGLEKMYQNKVEQRQMLGVWLTGGCRSYYQNSKGKISAIWPSLATSYWWQMKRFDYQSYFFTHAPPKI